MTRNAKWGAVIAAVSFTLICLATLTPETPASPGEVAEACRGWCDDSLLADFVRNIVLFAPLGFGLWLAGVRGWKIIVAGSCLSAIVEILQIRIVAGRDASILDWIANTTGTVAGLTLAAQLHVLLFPRRRVAARLLIASMLAWTGILTLGAWGVQPAPSNAPFWGQRAPHLGNTPPFHGALISARVNELELPSGRMERERELRASMQARRFVVDATVRPTSPYSLTSIGPIARVADHARREILMLGRGGSELVFRYRMRATTLRLETPAFALAHAFANTPTNSAETAPPESVSAVVSRGTVELSATGPEVNRERMFELGPAVAWSFFLPWDYWFGPNARFIALLWLAVLLIPAGYWMAAIMRERVSAPLLAAVSCSIIGVLLVLPSIFDLPSPGVWDFVAAAGGLTAGWLCGSALVPRALATREITDEFSVVQSSQTP